MTRGKYRVEHVDERPRGWRVRTKLSGAHVLRVGFPPGPRRRGTGRLLEVLHPREENNPSCPVSARAKSNPESLIVFGLGNPDREQLRKRLKAAQARFDAISAKQTEARRRLKPEHGESYILTPEWSALEPESDAAYKALESAKRAMNPGRRLSVPDKHQIKIAKDTLRMPDAMVGVMGGMTKPEAREVLRRHGIRFKENPETPAERKRREGETIVGFCPHCQKLFSAREVEAGESLRHLSKHRAERESQHRGDREQNPIRMSIEPDPSKKQFRASMKHPSGGSWLYAWGHTQKQAAARLRDEWRKARGKNPFDWRESRAAGPSAIKHGDRVTFVDRFGKRRTGKVVMRSSFGGWVLNMGGAHGTPQVVSEDSIVKVRRGNPGDSEALEKLEAARQRYEQAKTPAAKRAAAEDIEFWGNKAAFLGSTKNPRHRTVPEILRECDKIRAALRSRMRTYDANPRRRRHNPVSETEQAVKLFEVFHGKDPVKIVDKHVSAAMRKDYTALGKLVAVGLDDAGYGEREIAGKWDKCNHINFAEDGVTLASSPDGRQLYAIGGNQNLNGCLAKFQGVDPEKDFIDLGEVVFVVYEARKVHDNFEPVEYVHKFGGHGNTRPGWFYDRLKKQIFFIGGEYFIDIETKISPGIEG